MAVALESRMLARFRENRRVGGLRLPLGKMTSNHECCTMLATNMTGVLTIMISLFVIIAYLDYSLTPCGFDECFDYYEFRYS